MSDVHSLDLSIRYQLIPALKLRADNARTHSKHQIKQIADSIRFVGFTNPILVDRHNVIVAGHGRLKAAKLLGLDRVPTILLEALTPTQIRAYVIADNRLAENASWDKSILAIEFQHLLAIADFDVTLTGFDVPYIDLILQESAEQPESIEDFEDIGGPSVTQPGDLWQLGKHRVCCGSSLLSPKSTMLLKLLYSTIRCGGTQLQTCCNTLQTCQNCRWC
jgi:hypothetical protein